MAVSNSLSGPRVYVGPNGTSGTFLGTTGRYCRSKAYLTSNGSSTPTFSKVALSFTSGGNISTLYRWAYDGAGNLFSVSKETDTGTSTEVRDNAAWPAGGATTTWRYAYNLDGTLASKTDGVNGWTYTWDAAGLQQLLRIQGPGVDVSYTYDSMGRVLTSTSAAITTTFEWDNWDCVREFAPGGVYRYYCPQGELLTFDYTPTAGSTSTYCCHADALGSIRAITDSTGAVVAHFEFDAWGNLLASSSYGTLTGWPYLYVGAFGVRYDAASGMHYMRHRWYDPLLQRFISRDALRSENRYGYCVNDPIQNIDPSGLQPTQAELLQAAQQILDGQRQTVHGFTIVNNPNYYGETVYRDHMNISTPVFTDPPPAGTSMSTGQEAYYLALRVAGTEVHENYHYTHVSGLESSDERDAYNAEIAFYNNIRAGLPPGSWKLAPIDQRIRIATDKRDEVVRNLLRKEAEERRRKQEALRRKQRQGRRHRCRDAQPNSLISYTDIGGPGMA